MRQAARTTSGFDKLLPWGIVGGLLLAIALVYGQTLRFGFLEFDDYLFVTGSPVVRSGLNEKSIVWAFTNGPVGEWYPLSMLSHMLDCQLLRRHARGSLGTSSHQSPAARRHDGRPVLALAADDRLLWPSALVAMLFGIHPQHVESVAWIAERRDMLSGLLFVLTLWAYVEYVQRGRTIGRYLLVAPLLGLGLMAKAMLVTVPPLLLLLDYWPLGRFGRADRRMPSARRKPALLAAGRRKSRRTAGMWCVRDAPYRTCRLRTSGGSSSRNCRFRHWPWAMPSPPWPPTPTYRPRPPSLGVTGSARR